MYLDDNAPIAGGREIWGFPKKLGTPKVRHESETLVCTLHYGSVLCASATMGYKHREIDHAPLLASLAKPNFMLKIVPHVDCTPRICELVRYYLEDVTLKGAWSGPGALELFNHALCDVAQLPEAFGEARIALEFTSGNRALRHFADIDLGEFVIHGADRAALRLIPDWIREAHATGREEYLIRTIRTFAACSLNVK